MQRRVQCIHFVGIGGAGMSGIAELLHHQGYRVTGSDLHESKVVDRLRALGIDVAVGHDADNVASADVLVYSAAVRRSNPELQAAERREIPVIQRAEMLGELMRRKDGIAVAGTHGKTTTTSLVAHMLEHAGLDPTVVVGGRMRTQAGDPTGARLGKGDLLVAEACESDGSFLLLHPVVAVVTSIDPEHLDHHGSLEALQDAFVAFANRIPFWGTAIVCLDEPGVRAILPRLTRRVTTYGFSPQADLVATDIASDGFAMSFAVRQRGAPLGAARIHLPGRYNVANALAALAVALEVEVPFAAAAEALSSFMGVERRFETKGEARGVRVIDDYAHHPAEVRAALAAARAAHRGRLVVAFQPHRYSRTRDCFDEFATSFDDADLLFVSEIYAPAGEEKLAGVEGGLLADAVRAHGVRDVRFARDLDELAYSLAAELESGDLVLTLGAGSIADLGAKLLARLEGSAPC